MKFERIVEMTPAFDRRHTDPSKSYGIHGVDLRMVLKGDKGAVQFVLHTNWMLPHVERPRPGDEWMRDPMPADLGYHSPVKMYDSQTCVEESCTYLDGKPCYYDGSTLNAEPVFERLLREGHEGVWGALEEFYAMMFEGADDA